MSRVRSYNRKVNGKVFSVKAYTTRRERDLELNKPDKLRDFTRPPISAQPGQFPAQRKYPGVFLEYKVMEPPPDPTAQETQKDIDQAAQIVTDEGLKVIYGPSDKAQAAIALLRRHGHTVKSLESTATNNQTDADRLDSLRRNKKNRKGDARSEIKSSAQYFIHPQSGETVEVPEGGQVWRHFRFRNSFLVLSADGDPLVLVGKNGKAQKPPTHLKLSNFLPFDPKRGRRPTVKKTDQEIAQDLAVAIRVLRSMAGREEREE